MNNDVFSNHMEIDGSRSEDDQSWRISRIHRILGYAQALADIDNNEGFALKISSIYDDKGSLIVTWLTSPSQQEMEYLRKAWESIVTGYESNPIIHEVINFGTT